MKKYVLKSEDETSSKLYISTLTSTECILIEESVS